MAPIKTNNPYASYFDFFSRSGTDASTAAPPGIPSGVTATGGQIVNDYQSGGIYYRAHIFTSPGALDVTALGDFGNTVEYLIIAGGGSGGCGQGGGGGAGGYRSSVTGESTGGGGSLESAAPVVVAPYAIVVGSGGAGRGGGDGNGNQGTISSLAGPNISTITSTGGGYGSG